MLTMRFQQAVVLSATMNVHAGTALQETSTTLALNKIEVSCGN
jgi:hypothetical protein